VNQLSYECKFIKASEAERILKDLMGDGKATTGGSSSSSSSASSGPPTGRPVSTNKRLHFITSNERSNSILVTGPADKIAEAESILKRIDVGKTRILVGNPELKVYTVAAGAAEPIAKTLSEAYKSSATCRISTAGANKVLVYATPEDQIEIAKQILGTSDKAVGQKTITLDVGDRDPNEVSKTLSSMFGDTKSGAPYVEAVAERNAVVVRGSEEQLEEAKAIVKVICGSGAGGENAPRLRSINLDSGSASTLAEELARVLGKMRKNPVQVISPDSERDDSPKKTPAPTKPNKPEKESRAPGIPEDGSPVSAYQEQEGGLVDPRGKEAPQQDSRPGSSDKPVRIFASGNRLLISSDDPEALSLVQQLVNLYTKSPGKGDFKVIKLINANATEAAKALDEAFNGPKQPAAPGGGGPGGGPGGGFPGRPGGGGPGGGPPGRGGPGGRRGPQQRRNSRRRRSVEEL